MVTSSSFLRGKKSKFTTENIVAIIRAAGHGDSIANVVERSGADINAVTVHNWLSNGRGDLYKNKKTAYAVFANLYDKLNKPRYKSSEELRKKELIEALSILIEESNDAIWDNLKQSLC